VSKKALTLSIVIPVYNEEDHLRACLDSIAAQTVRPFEVIVVDNNSTDGSVAVARTYGFVRLLHESKQGIVHARTAGFNAVRGTLIGRLDADTVLDVDWVARVLAAYSKSQDFALTGSGYFYNVPIPAFNGWLLSQLAYRVNRLIVGHYITWGSNMVVPVALWRRVKPMLCTREDIHEDLDIAIHLHKAGYRITYDTELQVGVEMKRVYTDQQSLKKNLNLWPDTLRAHGFKRYWFGSVGAWLLYNLRSIVIVSRHLLWPVRQERYGLGEEIDY
jgi:glycosyltransferase involved in cell wall biosynthesis